MTVTWMSLKAIAQPDAHVILDVHMGNCEKTMCYESANDSRQPDVGQVCLWWCRQFVQVHVII